MKKKLSLKELKVQSFVTESSASNIVGGGPLDATQYSCYDYISCGKIECLANSRMNDCVLHSKIEMYCWFPDEKEAIP